MKEGVRNRLAWAVVAAGVVLRFGLAVVMPATAAYDDHFTPIRALLQEGHLPLPSECWECYQPPLYYVISGGVFTAVSHAAAIFGASVAGARAAGMKAIQLESAVFGSLTLLVCWHVLRRIAPGAEADEPARAAAPAGGGSGPGSKRAEARVRPQDSAPHPPRPGSATSVEALALALVAFLPQHIYMSAMVTNDALTYLLASLAVWAALRADAAGWPVRAALLTGVLCGLAVLSKAYGMATAAAVVCAVGLAAVTRSDRSSPAAASAGRRQREAAQRARSRRGRAALLVAAAALAVGIWPSVRNVSLYGKPLVDNFDLFKTRMLTQPPGSVEAIEWLTLRPVALMEHPWVHPSTVASFWTELYARFWFEYEGIVSLQKFPQWSAFMNRVIDRYRGHTPPGEAMITYGPGDVPAGLGHWARLSYLAGLPLTAIVLGGFAVSLLQWRRFPPALMALHFCACMSVPIVQTLRLPFFAAMKAAFALGALSSVPVFVVLLLAALGGRLRTVVMATGWAATAAIVLANAGYIAGQIRP